MGFGPYVGANDRRSARLDLLQLLPEAVHEVIEPAGQVHVPLAYALQHRVERAAVVIVELAQTIPSRSCCGHRAIPACAYSSLAVSSRSDSTSSRISGATGSVAFILSLFSFVSVTLDVSLARRKRRRSAP